MSYQQFFNELQAVAQVLHEAVAGEDDIADDQQEEIQAAMWQAAELLLRAQTVLFPLLAVDVAKSALVLPDPAVTDEQ